MEERAIAPYKALQRLRLQRGLTIHQLAALVGTHPSSIKKWEAGFREPGTEMLHRLADVLEVDPGDLQTSDL